MFFELKNNKYILIALIIPILLSYASYAKSAACPVGVRGAGPPAATHFFTSPDICQARVDNKYLSSHGYQVNCGVNNGADSGAAWENNVAYCKDKSDTACTETRPVAVTTGDAFYLKGTGTAAGVYINCSVTLGQDMTAVQYTPTTSATTSTERSSSAGKSAASGFMRTTGQAQNFAAQTQIHNRLFGSLLSSAQNTALSSKNRASFVANINALSSSYAASINRPSQTVWHSKDNLMGLLTGKENRSPQETENSISSNDYTGKGIKQNKLYVSRADNTVSPGAFDSTFDIWGSGGYTKIDSSKTGNNYDGHVWYGRLGVDTLVKENLLIGGFIGFDDGEADFDSLTTDLNTKADVVGGYFGYAIKSENVPLPIIIDGQISYSDVEYDIADTSNGVTGDFNADRWVGSLSITGVLHRPTSSGKLIRWLPKVGLNYSREKQNSYVNSAGILISSQNVSLGQLSLGTQVFVPVFETKLKNAEVFWRLEGQWDFDDVGSTQRADGTFYDPGNKGIVLGAGFRYNPTESTSFSIEASADGIGRSDYDQHSFLMQIDHRF